VCLCTEEVGKACCTGWDTEGYHASCDLPVVNKQVISRRYWCFWALCFNSVYIFFPWKRNGKYLSARSCFVHIKLSVCLFSPRPSQLCVVLLIVWWNTPGLDFCALQHSVLAHALPQTLGLWANWLSWGPGKSALWFTSSPWCITWLSLL